MKDPWCNGKQFQLLIWRSWVRIPARPPLFLFFSTKMITFVPCNIFEQIWYSEFILGIQNKIRCCCFSTGTLQGDERSRTKYVQDAYKKLTCMLLSMVFEQPWCPIFCSYWSQWMQKLKWLCHWHHFRYQYKLKSKSYLKLSWNYYYFVQNLCFDDKMKNLWTV